MKIVKNCVVTLEYELKGDDGVKIDASADTGPIVYLHGWDSLLPGLETAVAGREAGESLEVVIPHKEGYGEFDDELVEQVPRENFQGIDDIAPGMQFQTDANDGPEPMVVTVMEVDDSTVTVDGNHPLAGRDLYFSVEVKAVREATSEEVAHGHVHGEGGHHH